MSARKPSLKPTFIATLHRSDDILGGIQKHINVFAEEARQHGVPIDILTPFQVPKAAWFPMFGAGKMWTYISKRIHAWWYERTRFTLLRRVLLKRVPRTVPSIIYAQDPVSAEAALALKKQGYPVEVVCAIHFNLSTAEEWVGKGYLARGSGLYRKMLERDAHVFPYVDRLVFVSDFMKEQLSTRIPAVAKVPSYVVPNFVPTAPAPSPQPMMGELISIGTLEPRKNHAFIFQVLREAHRRGYPYKLTLVGGGASRSTLERLAKTLGLESHITFLGAVSDASSLLHQHLVYVHAARMENLPIVSLEALAAGKPICAAPVGGIPEVFSDGVEGAYWDLSDPSGAAQRLIQILETPDLYERMAKAAAARHAAHFSTDVVREKLIDAVYGRSSCEQKGARERDEQAL